MSDTTPATLSRAEQALADAAASAPKSTESRYTLAQGAEWLPTPDGGDTAVCNSKPNGRGQSFLYIVHRSRNGREIALPYVAVATLAAHDAL